MGAKAKHLNLDRRIIRVMESVTDVNGNTDLRVLWG